MGSGGELAIRSRVVQEAIEAKEEGVSGCRIGRREAFFLCVRVWVCVVLLRQQSAERIEFGFCLFVGKKQSAQQLLEEEGENEEQGGADSGGVMRSRRSRSRVWAGSRCPLAGTFRHAARRARRIYNCSKNIYHAFGWGNTDDRRTQIK